MLKRCGSYVSILKDMWVARILVQIRHPYLEAHALRLIRRGVTTSGLERRYVAVQSADGATISVSSEALMAKAPQGRRGFERALKGLGVLSGSAFVSSHRLA